MKDEKSLTSQHETSALAYTPIFDPTISTPRQAGVLNNISPYAKPKAALPYVYHTPEIVLAVNVALATDRPLLLSGRPGSGKSTLARHVASCLEWEYQEETVTSRTQANDLLWRFDALQRLSEASSTNVEVRAEREYVEPGVLWWTFNPDSAHLSSPRLKNMEKPSAFQKIRGIVVLLDEIDKAEPDVPNDLLVPLGDRSFVPRGHPTPVAATKKFLLCITTNGERELPQAFVRRCITLSLKRPSPERLREIAVAHHPELAQTDEVLDHVLSAFSALEKEMIRLRRRPPSTAEFLDAVQACLELKPSDRAEMARFTMQKIIETQDPEE
jgi:MoxR-like ATPase